MKYLQVFKYGNNIMKDHIERFGDALNVRNKLVGYGLQSHDATSDESVLGLGIKPSNKKKWFQI